MWYIHLGIALQGGGKLSLVHFVWVKIGNYISLCLLLHQPLASFSDIPELTPPQTLSTRFLGRFLFKKLKYSILHAPMLFSLLHMFHNCFCFCSTNTTFPSHMGTFGQRVIVLHCNYNRDVAPKFNLLIWLEGPIDPRSTRVSYILHDLLTGTTLHYFWPAKICAPNNCIWRNWPYLAVLGVVSAHIWANRTHQSKVITKSNFGETSQL